MVGFVVEFVCKQVSKQASKRDEMNLVRSLVVVKRVKAECLNARGEEETNDNDTCGYVDLTQARLHTHTHKKKETTTTMEGNVTVA